MKKQDNWKSAAGAYADRLQERATHSFTLSDQVKAELMKCVAAHEAGLALGDPPVDRSGGQWNHRKVAEVVIFLAVVVTTISLGLWVGTAGALTLERHIKQVHSEMAND